MNLYSIYELLCVLNFAFFEHSTAQSIRLSGYYPLRSGITDANDVEKAVCREITDRISFGSPRFNNELVRSANSKVNFCSNEYCKWVSSRLKSRLDVLANVYPHVMSILLAWSNSSYSYPYGIVESNSLHYEGTPHFSSTTFKQMVIYSSIIPCMIY